MEGTKGENGGKGGKWRGGGVLDRDTERIKGDDRLEGDGQEASLSCSKQDMD